MEMDILDDLESLKFEYGIPEEERYWLYLQGRYRGLMIKGCAHAVFFCKLLSTLSNERMDACRQKIQLGENILGKVKGCSASCVRTTLGVTAELFLMDSDVDEGSIQQLLQESRHTVYPRTVSFDATAAEDEKLKVGIIGCGHLGKQLANVLLRHVPISAENLKISTRRPEALVEFQKLGVWCVYDNASVAHWAQVLFLCCLPSQLPNICLEIQAKMEKTCIVYSFVSAIPLPRLKLLLNHTNILRPQYRFSEDNDNIWGEKKEITAVFEDPVILRGTCPYSNVGGITLNIKWLEGVFYSVINFCTARNVFHSHVLQILNKLFLPVHLESCEKDKASCPKFQLTDFMNKSYVKSLFHKRPFPWFDLAIVQIKETPFSQHLSTTPALQDHLTLLYCESFGISLAKEDVPEVPTDSPPQGDQD